MQTVSCFLWYRLGSSGLALLLPLLSWGQTATVNFDFNSASVYPAVSAAIASGINASVNIDSSGKALVMNSSLVPAVFTSTPSTPTLKVNTNGMLVPVIPMRYAASTKVGTATVIGANISGALLVPATVNKTLVTPAFYTWNGTSSTSYSNASNWSPARTTPAETDVLQFTNSSAASTVVLDYPPVSQTIGKLLVSSATVFSTDMSRTLTINDGSTGADLLITSGATLTVISSATSDNPGLAIQFGTGATASIAGTLIFGATTGATGAHTLISSGLANSVEFVSGSIFRAASGFTGSAFGSSAAAAMQGNVLFRNGSRYEQLAGSNPFGPTQPQAITVFEPNSTYYFAPATSVGASLSGRTYGNLEYNLAGTSTSDSGISVTIVGNLTLTNGTVNINMAGMNLQGNLLINGGTLNFNPSSVALVQLNGNTTQTIGGSAPASALTLNAITTLQVNNPAGVVLARPLTVPGTLSLTSGLLTTSAANLLTLASTATVTGTPSATSFVNGPLARVTGAGAATTVFPVGKGTFYRPITLTSTAQNAASTYTAEQFEGNPIRTLASGIGLSNAPLARVSSKRFYTVRSSNTTVGNFTGTITLNFGAEDYVNVPSSTDFVIAKRDATGSFANQWTNLGRSGNTGTNSGAGGPSVVGTLTSASFSGFSDFVLGAQNDLSNTNVLSAINPLPVQLTAFSVQRQADNTMAVKWTTASEKNSAHFEVQRSIGGREFSTVTTVAATGNSSQPTIYATLDKTAPAAMLYYRLRQVDRDGTFTFSPVAAVAGSSVAKVLLYPNPAHSSISFLDAEAIPYRVLNQLSQPLLQGTTEVGTTSIGIETLSTGLYFLELQTATGCTVQKFEKQ